MDIRLELPGELQGEQSPLNHQGLRLEPQRLARPGRGNFTIHQDEWTQVPRQLNSADSDSEGDRDDMMSISSLNPIDRDYREKRETYEEYQKCKADYQPIWLQAIADFHNLTEAELETVDEETPYAQEQLAKVQRDWKELPRYLFPLAMIGMSDEWLLQQMQAAPGGNLGPLYCHLVTLEKQRRNMLFLVIVAILLVWLLSINNSY